MRYLLDTNIMLDMLAGSGRLDHNVDAIVRDCGNLLYMSAGSIGELTAAWYKYEWVRKKCKTTEELIEYMQDEFFIEILYPDKDDYDKFRSIEWNIAEDHRDHVDILIIAHAMRRHLTLLSSDGRFHFYTKQGLDFIYNKR